MPGLPRTGGKGKQKYVQIKPYKMHNTDLAKISDRQ